MKHEFLLDENVIVLAAKGEDDHGNVDPSATKLVHLIGRNCHRITMHTVIAKRYYPHLKALEGRREYFIPQFVSLFAQLIKNSAKAVFDYAELPELAQGVVVPRKDVDIVRSALRPKSYIVTTDQPLLQAVNAFPALGLTAIGLPEALCLAESV